MTRLSVLIFSTLAILILSPLLIPVIVILKLTGEHEVFYRQERIGKDEKKFFVLKFATMLKDSPNLKGEFVTGVDDPRVLPFGKILRKMKINELPQLFNIWIGDMCVIGPRPVVERHYLLYGEARRKIISKLRPGLSGLGSLLFRDEEAMLARGGDEPKVVHDTIAAPYKGDLEVWYANNRSLGLYFKLIALTAAAVVVPSIKVVVYSKFRTFRKGSSSDMILLPAKTTDGGPYGTEFRQDYTDKRRNGKSPGRRGRTGNGRGNLEQDAGRRS